jgi:hypothetical protein
VSTTSARTTTIMTAQPGLHLSPNDLIALLGVLGRPSDAGSGEPTHTQPHSHLRLHPHACRRCTQFTNALAPPSYLLTHTALADAVPTHTDAHTRIQPCLCCANTHTHFSPACRCAYTHTHTLQPSAVPTHTCTRTCTHTHIRTHSLQPSAVPTHTHTLTHMQPWLPLCLLLRLPRSMPSQPPPPPLPLVLCPPLQTGVCVRER